MLKWEAEKKPNFNPRCPHVFEDSRQSTLLPSVSMLLPTVLLILSFAAALPKGLNSIFLQNLLDEEKISLL